MEGRWEDAEGGEEREGRGRREMRGEGRERREMRREGKVRDEREVVTSTSTYNCVHTGIHTHTHIPKAGSTVSRCAWSTLINV